MGFLKSVALDNIGNLDEAIDVENEKLTDGLRIFQGEVEDKWFLNALSMAAVEPSTFKKVNCLDIGTFLEL